jgi:hypothetical protein
MNGSIVYLKNKEIDKVLWDQCITNASNGLIYAYSYYLDAVCTNWDALVLNDYEAVMPLPWRKKWGIKYVYRPPFIQQLGVIGNEQNWDYELSLQKLTAKILYGDFFLNEFNLPPSFLQAKKHINYVLPLRQSFSDLTKAFSKDLKNNLKAAEKNDLNVNAEFMPELAIKTFYTAYKDRISTIQKTDYKSLLDLSCYLQQHDMAFTRTAQNSSKETFATGLFLRDKSRIYNILNATTNAGRALKANHYLLAAVVNEFSSTDYFFDFEGSELPGVKEFYENFKPINRPYAHFRYNRLPFPINFLKR